MPFAPSPLLSGTVRRSGLIWQRRLMAALLLASALLTPAMSAKAQTPAPVQIVAGENFYGALAERIGGSDVRVSSILSNPDQDPHSFEASPKVARILAGADLVIANGAAYDPWLQPLLNASPHPGRTVLNVADVVGKKVGDNPHLWYQPATMPAVARALAHYLSERDPAHQAQYQQRLNDTLATFAPVDARIAVLRSRYKGMKVSATEPVFAYMAQAIGLQMLNERFQLAVMNGTEPNASDVAAFENSLRTKEISVLIYNAQTSDQMSRRLLSLARKAGVPVVPVTETQPAGKNYAQWMLSQLDALDAALMQSKQPPAH